MDKIKWIKLAFEGIRIVETEVHEGRNFQIKRGDDSNLPLAEVRVLEEPREYKTINNLHYIDFKRENLGEDIVVIEEIYVLEKYRKQGLATALLNYVRLYYTLNNYIVIADENTKYAQAQLSTKDTIRRLFNKCGFVETTSEFESYNTKDIYSIRTYASSNYGIDWEKLEGMDFDRVNRIFLERGMDYVDASEVLAVVEYIKEHAMDLNEDKPISVTTHAEFKGTKHGFDLIIGEDTDIKDLGTYIVTNHRIVEGEEGGK